MCFMQTDTVLTYSILVVGLLKNIEDKEGNENKPTLTSLLQYITQTQRIKLSVITTTTHKK